jgi:ribonucleoside-triphosphate reductase
MTAIEQLELWKTYAIHWCEHKPSITVSVKEHEWMDVGAWVYENFDVASGVSFLPHSDHTYQQAPYQDIEPDEYLEWKQRMETVTSTGISCLSSKRKTTPVVRGNWPVLQVSVKW